MKSIRQLLRQPLRTGSGILLVALSVAILVTCVGQYTAGSLTREELDDNYDTVALLSDEYFFENDPEGGRIQHTVLPDEYQNWIDNTLMARTDLIHEESNTEVYSAYAPGLVPDNFSRHENGDSLGNPDNIGNPYRCAMLEVTLTQVGNTIYEDAVHVSRDGVTWTAMRNYISILCVGRVENVIGLEQGFVSPVGKTIVLTITAFDEAEFEAMNLQAGQRYLVYGMDYSDTRGLLLESDISMNRPGYEELFGPIPILDQPYVGYVDYSAIMDQIDCHMTVYDHCSMPVRIPDENGEMVVRHDKRKLITLENGKRVGQFVDLEEYPDYHVPTIVRLEGTAEAYLASDEAALWQRALDGLKINIHGFPVMAVDKLGYQVTFARGDTRITQGRDFTEEERTAASKVCVISETLATLNGLSVGDTIDLQTYAYDPNIEAQVITFLATKFPSAAIYSHNMGFTSEPETYTIVGLYRQKDAWQNREDAYGITPNVIFVPKGSISGDKLTRDSGIYYTLVLHNGKMEEFQTLQEEAGYPDLFICYDQGYMDIVTGLDAYEGIAKQVFFVGIGAYAAVMLLFILLFPLRQRATLATMGSLGASRARKITHLLLSSIDILIPGSIAGAVIGILSWDKVAAELMASVNVSIPLEADMLVTAPLVALAQLFAAVIGILILSVLITGSKNMMKRK